MPITASAKKALRQSLRRRARNRARKDAFKDSAKRYEKLATAKEVGAARDALARAYQALDKAAKTGAIKKRKASRLKSRLARLLRE